MAHRSGDVAVVRSVGSSPLAEDGQKSALLTNDDDTSAADNDDDGDLPQCKIKRNYSCNHCPFFSQNPRSFLYHSRDVHFDRIKIYECSQCLYASKHSQKLQRHVNMIHVAGKNRVKKVTKVVKAEKRKEPKPPDLPPKAVIPTATAIVPEKQEDETIPPEPKEEEDVFMPESDISDKELTCSVCNFVSKSHTLMRRHERVVHLKKRFLRCSKCSYVTHVKARYTKHVKYHSMPMIKCDLCDFRTPYKWNLDRHYKNHCGSGAFQCSKCNFRADIKQSLTVHEMNHHVPPVGQGAIMAKKKNKVGASETTALESDNIDKEELELLRMEREDVEAKGNKEAIPKPEEKNEDSTLSTAKNPTESKKNQHPRNKQHNSKRETTNNNNMQTDFIHPDDIVPRYGQIYVKNLKCKFCSYKAVFSHEIWRHEKRIHGYVRPENKKEKSPKRPPPKLIPIQNKVAASSPILKIPSVKNKTVKPTPSSPPLDNSVNDKEFSEMCKKSSLTSSLKDFVSLIGDEEGLKTIPDSQDDTESDSKTWSDSGEAAAIAATLGDVAADDNKKKQTDMLKKKNASFFDKLKEKLLTGANDDCNLFCDFCGHESKCLSEAVAHQKRHSNVGRSESDGHLENDVVLSGAELSSTRCQHCRQRCKTSTDLINHLKSCKAFGASLDLQPKLEPGLEVPEKDEKFSAEDEKMEEGNSMENRVFVWNELPKALEEDDEMDDENDAIDSEMREDYAAETTIYGTVTSKGSDNTESGTLVAEIDPRLSLTVKKVFKCPHCSFWASTASRFHVHIVGHLNKKPFECSLCLYRSNWRWDITKHIRLKSARDPGHLEAQVNMTDETGRRNYSKYNKYLTMMKVQEPTAESSGTGRRSRPCDATQGTVTDKDIIQPLPAPPRLTRAPTPGTAHRIPQGGPLRPPPPLKAAHQVSALMSKGLLVGSEPVKRLSRDPIKKTLWKCKKCNYRDSDKERVLAHVKEHYEKRISSSLIQKSVNSEDAAEETSPDANSSLSLLRTPPFRCGHCHQVSNWKHVIQRHCRLKHNGDVRIQVGWKDSPNSNSPLEPCISLDIPGETPGETQDVISCDICPFTTDTEGDLTAHKLNHVDRPGSIFKCTYCPFYVPSKIAVLEHMEVHGVENADDLATLKVDNFDPSECNNQFSIKNESNGIEQSKRYKCRQCPYVSNSKTQFLYHKQFHRPRDVPFKCMYCSYNVSRRHLLHQHLRVHHMHDEASTSGQRVDSTDTSNCREMNTIDMPEIPLVWVLKCGNFLKMFKCRWCPHVNQRKINIQDHEKMHRQASIKSGDPNQPAFRLQCPDCNYTCNNAGVLSSHVKVHQGFYGEIRSLVDPTKSDSEQIEQLQNSIRIVEPEVVLRVESDSEESPDSNKAIEEEMSSQPESAYNHTTNENSEPETKKLISFCNKCPARFFFKKELRIHSKFHLIRLPFRCLYCTYTARQKPHLLAHYKVHSQEYQQRTASLVDSYMVSSDAPQPKTAMITKESHVIEGPVWMVVSPENLIRTKQDGGNKPTAKHACHRCPAKFFKSVALQYHLTLHGGSHQHKCKYCDYTVKTYGNLIKHQLVHEDGQVKAKAKPKAPVTIPISGTELFQQRVEMLEARCEKKREEGATRRRTDPQFGAQMHGSPEFIYPTYFKNGKVKEKRYKCHKCPSAFEKREQYRIHLSLHGSKQKYSCEKCDYSVKYYANYVQHMRKHQSHDEAVEARKTESEVSEIKEEIPETPPEERKLQVYELTLIEQQTLLLLEKKRQNESKEEERKAFWCAYCPYVSHRRDAVDNHTRRHYCVSGMKSGFQCSHCDYTASQANFLREHVKLHFNRSSRHRAEAYLKCEKMELWCVEEKNDNRSHSESKTLVFQDRGENTDDRYFPPVSVPEDRDEDKVYVNPETGEPVKDGESLVVEVDLPYLMDSMCNEDLIEMIEVEQVDEMSQPVKRRRTLIPGIPKPKVKRWRGKNWKCKKCPHAFGKKDQYLRHVSLHGSNQRHNCDICDYSVKFYTNYVQHMRMHQNHEPDRIILVKKNAQNSEDLKIRQDGNAGANLNNNKESCDDLCDSTVEPKLEIEKLVETDYSSLTDCCTEMSLSSDEAQNQNDLRLNPVVAETTGMTEIKPEVSTVA